MSTNGSASSRGCRNSTFLPPLATIGHRTAFIGADRMMTLGSHGIADVLCVWLVAPWRRLDMATSGVMVFATSKRMQSWLGKQFQNHRVARSYTAVLDTTKSAAVDHLQGAGVHASC